MSESNNFCVKCGANLGLDKNFCPKCGSPVLSDVSNKETIRKQPERPKKKGLSKKKKLGIGILIAIVLLGFLFVIEIREQNLAVNERKQALLEEHKKWGLSEAMDRLNCSFDRIAKQPNGMWECL